MYSLSNVNAIIVAWEAVPQAWSVYFGIILFSVGWWVELHHWCIINSQSCAQLSTPPVVSNEGVTARQIMIVLD